MKFDLQKGSAHSKSRVLCLIVFVWTTTLLPACGNDDYQQAVQQSAAVVFASARDFLSHKKDVEGKGYIDYQVTDNQPLDLAKVNKLGVNTPEEIAVRENALGGWLSGSQQAYSYHQ